MLYYVPTSVYFLYSFREIIVSTYIDVEKMLIVFILQVYYI